MFCAYDRETREPRFATVLTSPDEFRRVLERERPGLAVFETCTIAGWVADLCEELGLAYQVANPLHEAWSWRKVKRQTDRDDALKLAQMADRGELPTVYVPTKAARQNQNTKLAAAELRSGSTDGVRPVHLRRHLTPAFVRAMRRRRRTGLAETTL